MSVRLMSMVFENQELSSTEKLVMLALADHANDEGKSIYPSQDRVSRKTGLARGTINRITKELIEKGYLRKVGYREERNNVLELEISIKSLFNTGVTESDTFRCNPELQTGVTEGDIKHHINHQLKEKGETTEEMEFELIKFFSEISGVPIPYKESHLAKWYVQVGEWLEMNFSKAELVDALNVASKDDMTIVRPASLTSFVIDMRAKEKRGAKPEPKSNNGIDPYPEFGIVYDENGVAYNAKGEVVNV